MKAAALRLREEMRMIGHLPTGEICQRGIQKFLLRPFRLRAEEWLAKRPGRVRKFQRELAQGFESGRGKGEGTAELRKGGRPLLFSAWGDDFRQAFSVRFPEAARKREAEAERICRHIFDLLGSGPVYLGTQIDWHRDFKSGKGWDPELYYKRVAMESPAGADILVPWWLSSFYHLLPLGQAYLFSSIANPQPAIPYALEFRDQIRQWIEHNPYPFGVNWASATIVSLRLIHWIWGFYFFRQSPEIPDSFWEEFLGQIYLHARHVQRNLEWFPVRTNHYAANLAALFYYGLLFPEFPEAGKWGEFAHRALVAEIAHQATADGVVHEGSFNYHRFVTEIFLTVFLLGKLHGRPFPAPYRRHLEAMLDFILHYSAPDGSVPQVGDGAPITLQNLGAPDLTGDHRWLLAIGAAVFYRPDFKGAAGRPPEALLWLLGRPGLLAYDGLGRAPRPPVRARSFPQGGFHIYQDETLYLLVRCGPLGMEGIRGHGHYDQLSFELWAKGEPVLIDPGWFAYEADPEMFRYFKATRAHNTVTVDGRDQIARDLFIYPPPRRAAPRLLEWEVGADGFRFAGEHRLYGDLPDPATHRRTMRWIKREGRLEILDTIEGRGPPAGEWNMHFSPHIILHDFSGGVGFRGCRVAGILAAEGAGAPGPLTKGRVAPRYGVLREGPVFRWLDEGRSPLTVRFTISLEEASR